MTMRWVLTVLDIVVFVAVLGYFLAKVARQLNSISANLGKITFGVRAVESETSTIGKAVPRLNQALSEVAAGLDQAASMAERAARR